MHQSCSGCHWRLLQVIVKRSLWLPFLGGLCSIGPVSIDMYLPAMPRIATTFGVARGDVQLSVTTYLVGVLVGQLVHGLASDRYGRKPPLCAGLLIYSVSSIACACIERADCFIALRFAQGFGGSAGMVIARAMIRDRTDTHEVARAFSLLMLIVSVVPLAAPLFGAAILGLSGWQAMFALMGALGVALLAGSIVSPETRSGDASVPSGRKRQFHALGGILASRRFIAYTLANGLLQGGMYAYVSMSSVIIVDAYERSPRAFGIMFATNSVGMVITARINAWLVRRFALRRIIERALWISVATSIPIAAAPEQPTLAMLLAVVFFYTAMIGFVAPNAAAMALADHAEHAGAASALLGTLLYGIGAISSVVASHIVPGTPVRALFVVMGACSALATLALYVAPPDRSVATNSR
ncbi:multidrug effflux MFS transporter [Trinickia sp. EG282A]|uniref:multidrug effflux MFS transporter n=1 Tax=Trinickia sp. EG282A TaxID=3237013 RepID=UPI0034D25DDC